MPNDDREQQFERALARHLRNASPDSGCPDAETLGAYHERTLSLEGMARWKEHIAGCARCQESLALVEQSEGVGAEEWENQDVPVSLEQLVLPESMRSAGVGVQQEETVLKASPVAEAATPIRKAAAHPPWRWVVPVGVLAASVIGWVGVKEVRVQQSHPVESVQVAQNRQAPPQAPAPRYEAGDQLRKQEPSTQNLDEEMHLQRTAPAPLPQSVGPQASGSIAKSIAPQPPAKAAAITKQKDLETSGAGNDALSAQPSPSTGNAARSLVAVTAAPPAPNAVPSGGLAGGVANRLAQENKKVAAPPSAAETVEVQSQAAAVDTTSASTSTLSSADIAINGRNVANLVQLAGGDRRYIVAPGEKHAWRVGEAGKIERSTDRGKTWKPQKSGVTVDLMAGSATSDKACWVVGKAGILLLTTDGGKHWKQITSPIRGDLGGIHATDALHASIWDVPNRQSFETSDGGVTWKRTSNE